MPQDKGKPGEFTGPITQAASRAADSVARGVSSVSGAVGDAAEAAGRSVAPVIDKASKQLSAGADAVAEAARKATREISGTMAEDLRDTVEETVKSRQDKFEAFLDSLSAAVEAGTKRLEKDGFHLTAGYAEAGARNLQAFARRCGDADLNVTTARLENYLRKRPLLTLGSAALLGFATYQFLKESPSGKPAKRAHGKASARS